MKSKVLILLLTILCDAQLRAQDSLNTQTEPIIYTGIYNQIPPSFNYPAIGVVNIANGNQKSAQVGFTNIVGGKMGGAQIGFSNTVGAEAQGAQVGFVNTVKENVNGVQAGFVNISMQHLDGVQAGYINYTNLCAKGVQAGFINLVGQSSEGVQAGFINLVHSCLIGAQVGFVNVVKDSVNGVQTGFVNISKGKVQGSQIGFINICDSISKGLPIGFLSIVKQGGYYGLEISYNELFAYNLALKIGVKNLYTSFAIGYSNEFKNKFAAGFGIGSLLSLSANNKWFINPELMQYSNLEKFTRQYAQLSTSLGINFNSISLKAGPTFVWSHINKTSLNDGLRQSLEKPTYTFGSKQINDRNLIHIGAKVSLVYNFGNN